MIISSQGSMGLKRANKLQSGDKLKILVTGGAGYIGSHTCLAFLRTGYKVQAADSLANGSLEVLNRVKILSNRNLMFAQCDIRDASRLDEIF